MNTIIEKIRAEIERLQHTDIPHTDEWWDGADYVRRRMKEVLSDLEKEEKPMNPACESKFKVGDVIQFKDGTNQYKICGVFSDHYINSIGNRMDKSYTDANFELVEHPVCEGLEEDVKSWFFNEISSKINVEHTMYYYFQECARRYAKWGAEHRGSSEIPKDLEEAVVCFSKNASDGHNYRDLRVGFIAGAKWQAEQDQETIELAEDHAYLAGAVNEREKMLREAVVAHCYGSANTASELGSPGHCISVCYNEKENTPHVVAGDQVKLFMVKED